MTVRPLLVLAIALATTTGCTAHHGHTEALKETVGNAELQKRLLRVEDELAIRRLLVEYAVRLDAKDLDGYLELFAEQGIWQIGDSVRQGREEIRAMLAGMYGSTTIEPMGYDRYRIITNMQIDIDGDKAVARSRHLTVMRGERGNPTPTLGGLYEDVLIRENGTWKILHRIDYPIMPTAEEWAEQIAEMLAREKQ